MFLSDFLIDIFIIVIIIILYDKIRKIINNKRKGGVNKNE